VQIILVAIAIAIVLHAQIVECLPIGKGPVSLRGVIEHKHAKSDTPAAPSLFLRLDSPICVEGIDRYGGVNKWRNMSSILLGIPIDLLDREFRDGESVELRGEIWGPAANDPSDVITFAIGQVL
jgi:hypothetical protein